MGLLIFIWLAVTTVLIAIAVKDGVFSPPLTRNKLTTRVSITLSITRISIALSILCWPLVILFLAVLRIRYELEDTE